MKRGELKNKRGLSPVIASVLLILLVLVLAVLIFLWARGFLTEQIQKFGEPIENSCEPISYDATLYSEGGDYLEVVNRGDVDIFRLDIFMEKDGEEISRKFDYPVYKGQSISKPIVLAMEDGSYPDKVTVYPVIVGKVVGKDTNKAYTCLEKGIVVFPTN